MKKISFLLLLALLLACESEGPSGPEPAENSAFDRQAMLTNWADQIIIPGLTAFAYETQKLKQASVAFSLTPTHNTLDSLRTAWQNTYLTWQKVSLFNIGKAAEIQLRENLNIYPADFEGIEVNIAQGAYNLELSSQHDRQGFPALDYLLFGLADDDVALLAFYSTHTRAENYKSYMRDLGMRIDTLTQLVLKNWTEEGYRESFINNMGSGSNSSINMLVNDFILYFEKNIRAGKIGIPAGVFSGNSLSTHTEAYYQQNLSKQLFMAALDASHDFFNGKGYATSADGKSLEDYLGFLQTMKNGEDLGQLIHQQFGAIRTQASQLQDNFVEQITTNNAALLATYDQLQLALVLLKVDMMQALNIQVDYVDADGD